MDCGEINEIDEAIKKTKAKVIRFHIGGGQYAEFPVISTKEEIIRGREV